MTDPHTLGILPVKSIPSLQTHHLYMVAGTPPLRGCSCLSFKVPACSLVFTVSADPEVINTLCTTVQQVYTSWQYHELPAVIHIKVCVTIAHSVNYIAS